MKAKFKVGDKVTVVTDKYGKWQQGLAGSIKEILRNNWVLVRFTKPTTSYGQNESAYEQVDIRKLTKLDIALK